MGQLIRDEDSFVRLFNESARTARRLETQTSYGVEQEDDAYRKFLAGDDPGIDWFRPWLDFVTEQTRLGKSIERVRVVDDPPIDYMRFEIALTPHNIRAGEDIRYLPRTVANQLGLPKEDYWLFDDNRLIFERFAEEDGWYLGFEPIEDDNVVKLHVKSFKEAWKHAIAYEEYIRMHPPST